MSLALLGILLTLAWLGYGAWQVYDLAAGGGPLQLLSRASDTLPGALFLPLAFLWAVVAYADLARRLRRLEARRGDLPSVSSGQSRLDRAKDPAREIGVPALDTMAPIEHEAASEPRLSFAWRDERAAEQDDPQAERGRDIRSR